MKLPPSGLPTYSSATTSVPMTEAHYLVRPSSRANLSTEATLFTEWLRSLDD